MLALRLRALSPAAALSHHARQRSTRARAFTSSRAWDALIKKPFLLADIGEGITECEIVKWLVTPDQVIDEFDPIVEVMSDKATVEITSPFKGRVMDLAGNVGDILKVGGKLCEVEVEVADDASTPSPPPTDIPTSVETPTAAAAIPVVVRSSTTGVLATPATRRMARESSINLEDVTGTGKDGRVTKSDVLDHLAAGATLSSSSTSPPSPSPHPASSSPPPPPSSKKTTTIPLSPVRKAMFRAMTSTLQIPHFSYSDTIDVTSLERLRLVLNQSIPPEYQRTLSPSSSLELDRLALWSPSTRASPTEQYDRLTLLPLLLKALSSAMHSHPLFSCTLDSPSQSLLLRPSHDISLALSGPLGGLYTPLLPSVNLLSPYTLASKIAHLQSLALASGGSPPKFPEESKGSGTITLSNVGVVGGTTTHPIVPPTGQLAIGAIGRTRVVPMYVEMDRKSAREVAVGGGDSKALRIEPRLLMDVTFSADHRVVEGVELARLVESWKRIIEAPEQLVGGGK
ncbi:hypothetical protein RQP46_009769 [Phenoliferia psychrophenolica]